MPERTIHSLEEASNTLEILIGMGVDHLPELLKESRTDLSRIPEVSMMLRAMSERSEALQRFFGKE